MVVVVGGEIVPGGGVGESFSDGDGDVEVAAGIEEADADAETTLNSRTSCTANRSVNRAKRAGKARAKGRSERSEDRRIPGLYLGLVRGDGSSSFCVLLLLPRCEAVGKALGQDSGCWAAWAIRDFW